MQASDEQSAGRTHSLASPLGILTVFPAIVLIVGVFLTVSGLRALEDSNLELGQRHLRAQAKLSASKVSAALAQADPVLDELAAFALTIESNAPLEPSAAVMRNLLRGHAGAAYVSASFPDGGFRGAFVDSEEVVLFQESRVTADGTQMRRFEYTGFQTLRPMLAMKTAYDPRTREFYRRSVAAGQRIWTPPYAFFENHYTGVTRTTPVFRQVDGQPRLHAVVTVDFDVAELSRLVESGVLAETRTLLFAKDGTLLAFPEGARRIAALPLPLDRPLSYRDLEDPVLNAFFGNLEQPPADGAPVRFRTPEGEEYLAIQAPVGDDPALDWAVAYLVPERTLFASMHAYGRHSAIVAGLAVVLALALSGVFARLVVRARRDVASARSAARVAQRAAKELGSYRLVQCLGKGGMGEVWLAEHRLLARQAAIKMIRVDAGAATVEARERFHREAQTLASLRSRNTIELFDYGVAEDGTFFFVMELLEGLDLEHLVEQHGPQPADRVVRILVQICRSLGEAHEAGLVHRDVKPANVFLCRAADEVDVVKVLDFGLVHTHADPTSADPSHGGAPVGPLTNAGRVVGTPECIAPEQALGEAVDGRADIYAVGCVAYWLLSGKPVFDKDTAVQLLMAHVNEAPPPLSDRVPEISAALAEVLFRCLAKEPSARPQTMRELLGALTALERELAPEALWTEERARDWWTANMPAQVPAEPGTTSGSAQYLHVAMRPQGS